MIAITGRAPKPVARDSQQQALFEQERSASHGAPFPGTEGPTLWARQDQGKTVHGWRRTTDSERRPISLCRQLWRAAVADFEPLYDEPPAGALCIECQVVDDDITGRSENRNPGHPDDGYAYSGCNCASCETIRYAPEQPAHGTY